MKTFKNASSFLTVKKNLINGRTDLAIQELLDFNFEDEERKNLVIGLSARYQKIIRNNAAGIISEEDADIAINKVNQAILSITKDSGRRRVELKKYSLITLISLLLCLLFLFFYTKHQSQESIKLAISEYRLFKANQEHQIVMHLLEWSRTKIDVYPNDNIDSQIVVRDAAVMKSLDLHKDRNNFTEFESRMKKLFDNFIEDLGYFNKYIEAGILKKENISEIKYWIEIMASPYNDFKSSEYKNKLKEYILYYKFEEFEKLCERFGYKLQT